MAQEAKTNMHMIRRCEPMGGEIDSNNRNTPTVINVSSHSNFTDAAPEENFIDDLTLKVRSLLKSWEDDISNDDSFDNHKMQDNSCNSQLALSKKFQVGKSAVPLSTDSSSSKIIPECQNSNELKCHLDASKFNPCGNLAGNSTIDNKTDFGSFNYQLGVKTSTNARENIREEIKKSFPSLIEGKSLIRSEFKKDKCLNHSNNSISKNSNYEMDDTIQSLRKTSTPKQTIEDPLSYNDFSNSLQGVRNISSAHEKNLNSPVEQIVFESPRKLSVYEQNSKQDIKNLNFNSSLNVIAPNDCHSRESSDKETERSWSEITVVAESYSEPSKHPITLSIENQNDYSNASASQPISFGECPKVFNSKLRAKENIKNVSRSANIYNKDIKLDTRDWRIEITDHDKNSQTSDKEYQFSDFLPNSNLSDFDQIDHDTPPLSASSMASSKRLEWDNGADIGYNVATMRSKVKYRSIPRSEPEGISFINEAGANAVPSKAMLPSFASVSSQGEPASVASLDGNSCETSSVHDPSVMEDVLERSSSPGSLSRSDSKKSVIYNSYKSSFAAENVSSSPNHSFIQAPKNSSWPDLTLKSSVPAADWQAVSSSKMLSKSDEQVGLVRHSKLTTKLELSHSPDFTSSGNNIYKSTDLSLLPERVLPIGDYFPSESQSVPKNNSTISTSHSCKNCQSVLSENISSAAADSNNQKTDDLYNLQEGDLESFEIDSESPNANQINNSNFPHHSAEGDWMNESAHDSDFNYITELSELADYQLQSFNSRPFLLLSQDSSRFKGSNFPNIVQNLLCNSNSVDHSVNGNLEVKPHIRWYPLPSTSNLQDIKNVSTQTADSFIATKQTDSLIQVADPQANYKELSNESSESKLEPESTVNLDKFSNQTRDNSSFLSTSTLSKASAVISKGTLKSQSNLNGRNNNSFSNNIHVPSDVPMIANKGAYSIVNQAEGKLHLSRLSNSMKKNLPLAESSLSPKSEVGKHGEMSPLTHLASPVITSNKSVQYQSSANDTRYGGKDSSYFDTRNAFSHQPSKYIFSGDYPASLVKRRVGVGECHTSSESINDKVSRENFRIQPDMQSKEPRNSSTGNTTKESSEKDEPGLQSSEVFDADYSSSVFSRFISNHLGNESANYNLPASHFRQDFDSTIPLVSAYNRNYVETTSDKYNSSSTIPLESIRLNPNEKVNSNVTNYERKCTDRPSSITNHFIQRETNVPQLLSENSPFYKSTQYQNKIVHKSHSDPLISSQNSKAACEEIKTLPESQKPPVNRKLDFELSSNSDADSFERIDCVETSSLKYSNIKDAPEFHQSQNPLSETISNSFLFNRRFYNNKNPFQDIENIPQSSQLSAEIPIFINDSHKSFFKEQSQLLSRNKMEKSKSIQKQFEHSDVVDEVHYIPADHILSRSKNFDINKKNYASVGIQVSPNVSKVEKCNFCHKTKDSHMNCCLKKEIFKTVLNETLAKKISTTKSKCATSFCVYPSGCYCCCNKTLQEAFNFHRSEIVERIELRKKEVEEKCKKKLFLHVPSASQTKSKQPNIKLNLKPLADVNRKNGKMSVNKENKRIRRSESSSWKNTSSQMARQKNLNKYNRIMSKIYSQRLKNETLKGKVNHQRHETLINS